MIGRDYLDNTSPKHHTHKTNPKFQSSIQKLRKKPSPPSSSADKAPNTKRLISPDYASLPSVVLTKIYSLLPFEDCLQASSTCKHWRMSLIQNSPGLWSHHFPPLSVYLCNEREDLASAAFKLTNFSNIASDLHFKFDASSAPLIRRLASMLSKTEQNFHNLKRLSLQPIFQSTIDKSLDNSELELNKIKILNSISNIILSARNIGHISLGFIATNGNHSTLLNDLSKLNIISALVKKHAVNLTSLHVSTCWTGRNNDALSSLLAFTNHDGASINSGCNNTGGNRGRFGYQCAIHLELGCLLSNFVSLQTLSIDCGDLGEGLIKSELFATSLKM